MDVFFKIVLLFVPAGVANMIPVLVKKVSFLDFTVSKKWFGNHKTWRGLFFGILGGTVFGTLWFWFFCGFGFLGSFLDFVLFSFLGSFGALVGDLIKSYFKRRLKVAEGTLWVPFDQTDYILGALIFSCFYVRLNLTQIFFVVLVFGIVHPIFNLIGYFLKIKDNKF